MSRSCDKLMETFSTNFSAIIIQTTTTGIVL